MIDWDDGVVFESHEAQKTWDRAWSRVSDLVVAFALLSYGLAIASWPVGLPLGWGVWFLLQGTFGAYLQRRVFLYRWRKNNAYLNQLRRDVDAVVKVDRQSGQFEPFRHLDAS